MIFNYILCVNLMKFINSCDFYFIFAPKVKKSDEKAEKFILSLDRPIQICYNCHIGIQIRQGSCL